MKSAAEYDDGLTCTIDSFRQLLKWWFFERTGIRDEKIWYDKDNGALGCSCHCFTPYSTLDLGTFYPPHADQSFDAVARRRPVGEEYAARSQRLSIFSTVSHGGCP